VTSPSADQSRDDLHGPFTRLIGMEYVEASGSRVVATWTAQEKHHQPFGIVHGGVHCSIVETLASIGGFLWLDGDGYCVGVNNSTDFYRPVRTGDLRSEATPVHQGRSQQVWVVETRDDQDRLVARGQVRLQNLREG
jgi:1,4-dihydroxy-2-naphthoyl-CoA hydrolase